MRRSSSVALALAAALLACDVPESAYQYTDSGVSPPDESTAGVDASDPADGNQDDAVTDGSTVSTDDTTTAPEEDAVDTETTTSEDEPATGPETSTETATDVAPEEEPQQETTLEAVLEANGEAARGLELFRANCTECHTVMIRSRIDKLSEEDVINAILEGPGRMPSFAATLSAQEIADITAWLLE